MPVFQWGRDLSLKFGLKWRGSFYREDTIEAVTDWKKKFEKLILFKLKQAIRDKIGNVS